MDKTVIILLTPFQLRQLAIVAEQYNWNLSDALFFSLPLVPKENIVAALKLDQVSHFYIPEDQVSLPKLLKKPFSEIPRHRNLLKQFEQKIISALGEDKISELIIGSEKELFTQLLFKRLGNGAKVRALDEGTGYYKDASTRDKIFRILYPILTPILFGQKLSYVSTLGKHKIIDEVYARFPEDIPSKPSHIKYFAIAPLAVKENKKHSKNLLIFTSPLAEDHHCSDAQEQEILKSIIATLPKNWSIDLKAHPREVMRKYDTLLDDRFTVLDSKQTAEGFDYQHYKYILHFGSSVVLDLYQSGFPLDRVITLDLNYAPNKLAQGLCKRGKYVLLFSPKMTEYLQKFLSNG